VPGMRIGDGLDLLAGCKRVTLHLLGRRLGGRRRWRGCGGPRLLRATGGRREQAGPEEKPEEKEERRKKC
jgi:hypothetical protein